MESEQDEQARRNRENRVRLVGAGSIHTSGLVNAIMQCREGGARVVEASRITKEEPQPETEEEKIAYMVRRYRELGVFAPKTKGNPLSRYLTDAEMRTKVIVSKETWQKAQAKRARKMAKRLQV